MPEVIFPDPKAALKTKHSTKQRDAPTPAASAPVAVWRNDEQQAMFITRTTLSIRAGFTVLRFNFRGGRSQGE
jgi:alpha/beta superfamily hydrolase